MEVNKQSLSDQYSFLYQSRYCYQDDVDVIIFKRNAVSEYADELLKFKGMDFTTHECVPLMKPKGYFGKAVIGQDIYVVSESNSCEDLGIVETYSMKSGNWKSTTQLLHMRYNFCVCSFKQNLFIIGGNYKYENYLNTCLKYDVKHNKWSSVANINEEKDQLACTVFDGQIVISGGYYSENVYFSFEYLESVEAYDHHKDKWTFLADMKFGRYGHSAVSMGNKMFIIGGFGQVFITLPCEVYDKVSKKFSCIEPPGISTYVVNQPYCVGNKIVLITDWYENTVNFCVCDVSKNSWSTHEKQLM